MNHNDVENLLFFIDRLIYARETFELLKHDEEERKKSTLLGRRGLVYGITILIFIAGAASLVIWGLTMDANWKTVLTIIAAVIIVLATIPFYILSLSFSIKQLRLNRRAIGWISLFLPMVATIAAVVAVLIFAM